MAPWPLRVVYTTVNPEASVGRKRWPKPMIITGLFFAEYARVSEDMLDILGGV